MPLSDKYQHTSTASLLADLLRRREAPFAKVFCWLRRDTGVLERSPPVPGAARLVEMTFPYLAYGTPGADRLAIFADWLVRAVATGAPELGIDDNEAEELKSKLSAKGYIYRRTDKLKRTTGEPRCEIIYEHGPTELVVTARCKIPYGRTITRTLKKHPFERHELIYGRAITRCAVGEGDELLIESLDGPL